MEQGKHYSGLTLKEETGTRLWFETPDGNPIAYKCKEEFIRTYKKHRKIEVEQWKEKESEMLQALRKDCQNLNSIIQAMGEENFINSMTECEIKYEDVLWDISDCEELLNEYKAQKIYKDLSFSYAHTLLSDVTGIYRENLIGANEKVLDKYLEGALEIESDTKVNMDLFDALQACYGIFLPDNANIAECLLATIFSDKEMMLYKGNCEVFSVDAKDDPTEKQKETSTRLALIAKVRVLQEVLKICE